MTILYSLEKRLHLPILFPAWMLISHLLASGQPIVMLLPKNAISEEFQLEDFIPSTRFLDADHESMNWKCPWADYSVLDRVAPSFKLLMKENLSLHSSGENWWTQRTRLDKCLKNLLKSMEDSWFGPWICLLLGSLSDRSNISNSFVKLIEELKLHFKSEANQNLVKSILGGSKAYAEECIPQLLSY